MTLSLRRRRFLAGLALSGLSVFAWGCRPATAPEGTLQLWTLQLAPKFNPYMNDVLFSWDRLPNLLSGPPKRAGVGPDGIIFAALFFGSSYHVQMLLQLAE